jgi:hypothetical protein
MELTKYYKYISLGNFKYYSHYEGFISKKMLEGWDINDLFLWQVKNGNLFYVKKMLNDERVDPTYCQHDCIVLSVIYKHYSIFDLLYMDERIDPSTQNNLHLMISIQYNDTYIKQKLETSSKVLKSLHIH